MAERVDESLPELFWSVARQMRRTNRESLAPWDISPSHARALAVLRRHGALRLSELSHHLHIAPRSGTEVIDTLEERGLVERRPDPDDRRATIVELTDRGTEVTTAIWSARTAESDAVFSRLSATDRAHLARILRKLGAD
ncbi:MAG TPA: MarR family transcriptional regulator [Jatrophihabitans sp.]|uniref:MarR family winged helix-turn-helix transcriptional regulator n=1 Tax=Jatrophihabitans sp. TaxID=1932789 RepID=UPI002DFD389F|nr:MarR family transcriptional regulator [Jatrophihabitans sp.]